MSVRTTTSMTPVGVCPQCIDCDTYARRGNFKTGYSSTPEAEEKCLLRYQCNHKSGLTQYPSTTKGRSSMILPPTLVEALCPTYYSKLEQYSAPTTWGRSVLTHPTAGGLSIVSACLYHPTIPSQLKSLMKIQCFQHGCKLLVRILY